MKNGRDNTRKNITITELYRKDSAVFMRRYYSALKYAGQSIVRKFGENDFMSKKKAAALFAVGIIGIALGGGYCAPQDRRVIR